MDPCHRACPARENRVFAGQSRGAFLKTGAKASVATVKAAQFRRKPDSTRVATTPCRRASGVLQPIIIRSMSFRVLTRRLREPSLISLPRASVTSLARTRMPWGEPSGFLMGVLVTLKILPSGRVSSLRMKESDARASRSESVHSGESTGLLSLNIELVRRSSSAALFHSSQLPSGALSIIASGMASFMMPWTYLSLNAVSDDPPATSSFNARSPRGIHHYTQKPQNGKRAPVKAPASLFAGWGYWGWEPGRRIPGASLPRGIPGRARRS